MEFYYWVGGLAITISTSLSDCSFHLSSSGSRLWRAQRPVQCAAGFGRLTSWDRCGWSVEDWMSIGKVRRRQLMFQKPLKNTTHTLNSHMCFLGVPFLWTNDSWNCGRTETSSLIAMWAVQSGHTPKSLVNIAPGTAQFTWTKTGTISDPFAGNHIVFTVFWDTARWHATPIRQSPCNVCVWQLFPIKTLATTPVPAQTLQNPFPHWKR